MKRSPSNRLLPVLAFMLALGFAVQCLGCNVPVFRYALERWEPDDYQLVVAAKGVLPPDARKRVDEIARQTYEEEGFCNLTVQELDITDESSKDLLKTYPAMAQVTEPTAFLLYPESARLQAVILQEPLTDATVRNLTSSAFVEKLMLDIVKGASAVWVLVDSGDQAADDEAFRVLTETLEAVAQKIEIPPGVIETSGSISGGLTKEDLRGRHDPDDVLMSGIPLKIGFSVERLTKEQAEPALRGIVMNSEDDLIDYADQPMAFPVFGRGRFLVPLVGDSIDSKNIALACLYICGRCSCQVKSGNPGVDLLSHVDWDSYLGESEVVHDKELPPLTGTADLTETSAPPPPPAIAVAAEPVPASTLGRNILIALGAALGVVAGISFYIVRK